MEALDIARKQVVTGDRDGARRALVASLREEPSNIEAWLLLAPLLADPAQQAECYRRVLRLEPHHLQATALLSALTRRRPASPPPATRPAASVSRQPPTPAGIPNPFAEEGSENEAAALADEPEVLDEIRADLEAAQSDIAEPQDEQGRGLRDWVVRELTQHVGQNDIIRQICTRTGRDWPQAEKLVRRIAQEERHTIANRQAPLLIVLSIGIFAGGGAIFAFTYRPEGLLMMLGGFIGLLRVWYTLREK